MDNARVKRYSGYRSFQYLEPRVDYRDFEIAKEVGRIELYQVPLSELEEKAMSLARRMAEHSPRAIELSKRLLYQGLSTDFETVQHLTAAYQSLKL